MKNLNIVTKGKKWIIANADPMAFNSPGVPRHVKITESGTGKLGESVAASPHSVTLLSFGER
jgi:hypothetical protein